NAPPFPSVNRMNRHVRVVATLAGAAALGAMAAVPAPPAHAEGPWVSIAWSTKQFVTGTGSANQSDDAEELAMGACMAKGGEFCQGKRPVESVGVARAQGGERFTAGVGPTREPAEADAKAKNNAAGGSPIIDGICPAAAPAQKAPPQARTGTDTDGDGLS